MTPAQIALELREQITSGLLPQGAQLPTQIALASHYGVSRDAVRTAIAELATAGLVESRVPAGTFVREQRVIPYRPQKGHGQASPQLARYLDRLGSGGDGLVGDVEVRVVKCPPPIAEHFEVPEGSPVALRAVVFRVGGEPHRIGDTYYPLGIAKDTALLDPDPLPHGHDAVLGSAGLAVARELDLWTWRQPTPEERRRLGLPGAGAPVAVHVCVGYTAGGAGGRAVRCTVSVLPGDRHIVIYERGR
jgi:DNA-binding GntR family transcriptional regulator